MKSSGGWRLRRFYCAEGDRKFQLFTRWDGKYRDFVGMFHADVSPCKTFTDPWMAPSRGPIPDRTAIFKWTYNVYATASSMRKPPMPVLTLENIECVATLVSPDRLQRK